MLKKGCKKLHLLGFTDFVKNYSLYSHILPFIQSCDSTSWLRPTMYNQFQHFYGSEYIATAAELRAFCGSIPDVYDLSQTQVLTYTMAYQSLMKYTSIIPNCQ